MTSPTIISDDQPLDPVDERLVAYLDGELDPAARDQLENELIDDEQLRNRLQDLQRGWDFLEELPSATPSEQLVETTMELVVKDITKASSQTGSFWKRWRVALSVTVSCTVALAVGYAAVHFARQRAFDQKMADLELAEDLDAYLDGSDLNLMRFLSMNEDWQLMADALKEVQQSGKPTLIADTPLDQRPQMITTLRRDEAAALAARWETFSNLRPQTQSQVRETAHLVSQQSDAARIRETMRDYSLWINSLPAKSVDDIKAASAESDGEMTPKLKQAIEDAIAYTRMELPKESSRMISDETEETIMHAMKTIIDQRLESRYSPLSEAKRRVLERNDQGTGTGPSEKFMTAYLAAQFLDFPFNRGRRPELTDTEIDFILRWLPTEDLDRIDMLAMDNEMLRLVTIKSMIAEAVTRSFRSLGLSAAERYKMMTDDERLRLDLQPPGDIEERLARDRWGGPGRGPGSLGGRQRGGPPRGR